MDPSSGSCQSMDWRLQHKFACLPLLELYGWVESDAESTGTVDGGADNAVGGTAAGDDTRPLFGSTQAPSM